MQSTVLTSNHMNDKYRNIIRVTAAIMAKDDQVLIAKRKEGDHLANKLEFPGGKIENNETPVECLKREMKEEFDIEVSVREYLGSSICHYNHISIELFAYRTLWKGGNISLRDHDDFKWVSLKDLGKYDFAPADIPFVENLRRGEIKL